MLTLCIAMFCYNILCDAEFLCNKFIVMQGKYFMHGCDYVYSYMHTFKSKYLIPAFPFKTQIIKTIG